MSIVLDNEESLTAVTTMTTLAEMPTPAERELERQTRRLVAAKEKVAEVTEARDDAVVAMAQEPKVSLQKIADIAGVSRQQVFVILKARGVKTVRGMSTQPRRAKPK